MELKKIFYVLGLLLLTWQVKAQNEFITTWQTTTNGEQITIPTQVGDYDYTVDWGDGTKEANQTSHTYATAGIYTVKIAGAFPRIYFNNSSSRLKILSVENWGNNQWTSMSRAFYGCQYLVVNATDAPDLSNCTSMESMFRGCISLNQDISHWDVSSITNMENLFFGAHAFNQSVDAWDVSRVTNMYGTFKDARAFNQPLNSWQVDHVTTMQDMFGNARSFNQPLTNWNVEQVTSMQVMFAQAHAFNADISTWNTASVTTMLGMFSGARSFNQPVNDWDVSQVTDMRGMFSGALVFNQNLNDWDVSQVTIMKDLFKDAKVFNGEISNWDVSKVTDMTSMFQSASNFNQPIGNWSVGNVTEMRNIFYAASTFNQDIGNWDISKLRSIDNIFREATAFNQDISTWDVSNVIWMRYAFKNASSFDQSLGNWDISYAISLHYMLDDSGLSQENYDKTLVGWSSLSPRSRRTVGVAGLNYCDGANARQYMIDDFSWNFNGDELFCPEETFITTWQTTSTNETITIPTNSSYTYNYTVDWGDGTVETGFTGNASHTYATAGTYTVIISETFPAIYFNNGGHKNKILSIEQWGTAMEWSSMLKAFFGCTKLNINATDAPDLSKCTSLLSMFENCTSLNQDLNHWDVSNITDMMKMFDGATSFNGDISSWNTSQVRVMTWLFDGASSFNSNISGWDISSVIDMGFMFNGATSFNQNLGDWDISKAVFLDDMLNGTDLSQENYDSTLIGWSTLAIRSHRTKLGVAGLNYCDGANARQYIIDNFDWNFDGDIHFCHEKIFITTWQTTSTNETITIPTNSSYTYNYTIDWGDGTAETGFTGNATHTYANSGTYTVQISGDFPAIYFRNEGSRGNILSVEQWGDIEWASMEHAFYGCHNLNINATDAPNLSNCTSLANMFEYCSTLNQDLNHWDVSNITDMRNMFHYATSFNGAVYSWDVGEVESMFLMFYNASSFNQNLGSWDIQNAYSMDLIFDNTALSIPNYDSTLIGWASQSVQSNVNISARNLKYCQGAEARQTLIDDYGWLFRRDVLDCADEATTRTISNNAIRLEKDIQTSGIQAYSNAKTVWVKFENQAKANAQIAIYDLLGQQVLKTSNTSKLEKSFEITRTGIYIIRVENKYGVVSKKVFIN